MSRKEFSSIFRQNQWSWSFGGNGSLAARRRARVARRGCALILRASRRFAYTARASRRELPGGGARSSP
jgi:hypothetical protein